MERTRPAATLRTGPRGWAVNAPDGSLAVAGIDVITFSDGRIHTALGFFGDLEAVA